MRFTRMRLVLCTSVLAPAMVAGGWVVLSASTADAAPAAVSQVVLVNACSGAGQVRPGSYDPGCMPSSEIISKLTWTSWRANAFGHGTFAVNNCTPSSSCGPANYTKYPILAVLWRAAAWPHHPGRRYFSRLTVIFTGSGTSRPAGPVTRTFTLPAKG